MKYNILKFYNLYNILIEAGFSTSVIAKPKSKFTFKKSITKDFSVAHKELLSGSYYFEEDKNYYFFQEDRLYNVRFTEKNSFYDISFYASKQSGINNPWENEEYFYENYKLNSIFTLESVALKDSLSFWLKLIKIVKAYAKKAKVTHFGFYGSSGKNRVLSQVQLEAYKNVIKLHSSYFISNYLKRSEGDRFLTDSELSYLTRLFKKEYENYKNSKFSLLQETEQSLEKSKEVLENVVPCLRYVETLLRYSYEELCDLLGVQTTEKTKQLYNDSVSKLNSYVSSQEYKKSFNRLLTGYETLKKNFSDLQVLAEYDTKSNKLNESLKNTAEFLRSYAESVLFVVNKEPQNFNKLSNDFLKLSIKDKSKMWKLSSGTVDTLEDLSNISTQSIEYLLTLKTQEKLIGVLSTVKELKVSSFLKKVEAVFQNLIKAYKLQRFTKEVRENTVTSLLDALEGEVVAKPNKVTLLNVKYALLKTTKEVSKRYGYTRLRSNYKNTLNKVAKDLYDSLKINSNPNYLTKYVWDPVHPNAIIEITEEGLLAIFNEREKRYYKILLQLGVPKSNITYNGNYIIFNTENFNKRKK
jgi:hypothetical protein